MNRETWSAANKEWLYYFLFIFLASATDDQHLVVDHGGGEEKRVDLIEESDFVLFLLVPPGPDPAADVPRRLRLGHRVEGCKRSAELVLEINLKVGGWDGGQGYGQVRVTGGSMCPTPSGANQCGHCLPSHRVTKVSRLCKQQIIFAQFDLLSH